MTEVKRDYKSRMFTMIFSDKKELLSLYNAVANRNYDNPELLEINTLENAIYMSMKNDLSYIIDLRLKLYEHQSTYNPNIPLRLLIYLAKLYSKITANENLYGTKLIKIQAPQFVVFYNGVEKRPEREILKLSDAYMTQDKDIALELKVEVININVGCNEDIKKACKTLDDYSIYVQRVRDHKAEGMSIEEAVELAVEECIREDILREFLIKDKARAIEVSIFEYNEEEHMRMEREQYYAEGREEGREEGRAEGHAEGRAIELVRLCREFGQSEEDILKRLMKDLNLTKEQALKYLE